MLGGVVILEVIVDQQSPPLSATGRIDGQGLCQAFRPTKRYIETDSEGIQARHGPQIDAYYPDVSMFAAWGITIHGHLVEKGLWLKVVGTRGPLPVE